MTPASCPACVAADSPVIEDVPLPHLASVWDRLHPGSGEMLLRYAAESGRQSAVIRRCGECRLEFADPAFAVPEGWYAQFERYGLRWEYWEALKRLGPDGCVLDVGCGEGHFLALAADAGKKAIGVDFNSAAVERAKAKGLHAAVGGLEAIPALAAGHPVTGVTMFHVIEHLTDPFGLVAALADVVRPGGTLHVSCPGPRRHTTALDRRTRAGMRDVWDYPPFHQTRWNRQAFERLFTRSGWRLATIVEEPFHLWGESVAHCVRNYGVHSLPKPIRLGAILFTAVRFFPAKWRYRGMSIYAMAERV